MGKGYRQGRMGGEIQRIIGDMLLNGVKDPRLSGIVSISGVSVTRDGSYATCYVTVLQTEADPAVRAEKETEVLTGLESAKGLFKREMGRQLQVRRLPELIFRMDHSMDYGRHITEILDTLDIPEDEPGREAQAGGGEDGAL